MIRKERAFRKKPLETNSLEVRFLSIRTLDYLHIKDYFISGHCTLRVR